MKLTVGQLVPVYIDEEILFFTIINISRDSCLVSISSNLLGISSGSRRYSLSSVSIEDIKDYRDSFVEMFK